MGDDDDAQSTDFMDAAFRDYQRMQDDDDDDDDFAPEPIATGGIPSDKGFDDATRGGVAQVLAVMEQQNERYKFEVCVCFLQIPRSGCISCSKRFCNYHLHCGVATGGQRPYDVHSCFRVAAWVRALQHD